HGDPNLALELRGVAEVGLEGTAVDRDLRGQRARARPVATRRPEERAEYVRAHRALVLHDDGHVLQFAGDVVGQEVERRAHMLLELGLFHQYAGWSGGRFLKRCTVTTPKTKPPTCAKKATPPPASGCSS